MLGICTDSGSQLPPALVDRYSIGVVPLTVTVDGDDFIEGVDLDADGFYARFLDGATPSVQTAAPPPGRFLGVWRQLQEAGADEIVSIHLAATYSATVGAARLAASLAADDESCGVHIPVRVVDSGTVSFSVGCCTWEAAEAAGAGATADEVAALAAAVGATCTNVFIVGALDLVRAGGRLVGGSGEGIAVLSALGAGIEVVARAHTVEEACTAMADVVWATGAGLRVGLSIADAAARPVADALEGLLRTDTRVADLVHYRVGPSMGAHSGPGTAGAVAYPAVR